MKRKLLSVFMVLVLAIGCVFSLTACGNANEKYNEFVKTAAKDYYETHVDYKNFEDITIEYSATANEEEESEAEGKVDSEKSVVTATVSIQKVGEEYAILSEMTSTVDEAYWVLKEDSTTEYEEIKVTTVMSTKTIMFSKLENQIAKFYAVQESSMKVNDEEAVETKMYRELDESIYVSAIERAMDEVNDAMAVFYQTGTKQALNSLEEQGAEIELKVKKEDATLKAIVSDFEVMGEYIEGANEVEAEFVAGKASKYMMSITMTGISESNSMVQDYAVSYSADVPSVDLADYVIGYVDINNLVPFGGMW